MKQTQEKNIGTLIMFAVRRALSRADAAKAVVQELVSSGAVRGDLIDAEDPLGFLSYPEVADSIVEAAYRFCRHESGAHVVLTGTGSLDHLADNLAAIAKPKLPAATLRRLQTLFGHVDSVSGN